MEPLDAVPRLEFLSGAGEVLMIRVMSLAVLAFLQTTDRPPTESDCLFADDSPAPTGCSTDPYQVAGQPMIISALGALGVNSNQIVFYGCSGGRFSTHMPGAGSFVVSYPLSPTYAFANYVGPLTHELGHVAQLREAGSMPALKGSLDSPHRELGADFITGFMFRRYMNNLNQAAFERSLDLLGNYSPDASHSRPEARTAAFRMGFYYASDTATLVAAHRDFQRNRFGGIINEMIP